MIFDSPIPFAEALASRKVKRLLPTSAGSAELAKLAPEIRERAFFSAKVENVQLLSKMDRMINGVVSMADGRGTVDGRKSALSADEVRGELKDQLRKAGYVAPEGKAGGLQDLSSSQRLNLIIKTNNDMAAGAGQFALQNDPDILDAYPCLELYRLESREVPRAWQERWVRAGGKLYGGRMIATKDSNVWKAISRFGTPYPPFDFNSGMWTEEVSRAEAEELGVIKRSTVVAPQELSFENERDVEFPQGISSSLAESLKQVFETRDGKIVLTPVAAKASAAIREVFDAAQAGEKLWKDYAPVSPLAATRIKEATGLDVSGYQHTLDEASVNHILNEHGDARREAAQGQIAIKADDFEKLPWVVETGSVKSGGLTKQGLETIEYSKEVDGELIVIEEVRTGRKKLVPKTMYKKKSGTRAPHAD